MKADTDVLAAASLLMRSGATLAVAESCTGGLITHLLTEAPGISSVLLMGITAYSNDVKISQLGVASEAIDAHGAVSEPVAVAMAEGVRRLAGADYGIGVTGIAGPSGGTEEKPVGTVWIAVAGSQRSRSGKFMFHGERTDIKMKAGNAALDMLRRTLTE